MISAHLLCPDRYRRKGETMAIRSTSRKRSLDSSRLSVRDLKGVAPPPTTRLTVNLSLELVDRLRDTVSALAPLTLSGLVAHAIGATLGHLESRNGGPFPHRHHELKPGRPRQRPSAHAIQGQAEAYVRTPSLEHSQSHPLPEAVYQHGLAKAGDAPADQQRTAG